MKIVSIGGGEISTGETLPIDKYIIGLTNKARPKLLFIPTASYDSDTYIKNVTEAYQSLGVGVLSLKMAGTCISKEEIEQLIEDAGILYVGGGNTRFMMEVWREHDFLKVLQQAGDTGKILCGLSAGAIAWFESGLSDSDRFSNNSNWKFRKVPATGFLPSPGL